MLGDATLFQRADMVEAAWRVVAPIQNVWNALEPRDFPNYSAGTWGPDAADALLSRDGRAWCVWSLRTPNAETTSSTRASDETSKVKQ